MKLSGNTILITGATSGIGYELLGRFYRLGNTMIACSSNLERLQKLAAEFNGISILHCNLADSLSVQAAIQYCKLQHPEINILINNAGVQYQYEWLEEADGLLKIREETEVNLLAPLQLSYGLLPLLSSAKSAALVFVSSALIYAPKRSAPVYCASKAALHSVAMSLRYQLAQGPVKVFELVPPLVDTPMTAGRGQGKISPRQLADAFIWGFKRNQYMIHAGKSQWLKHLHRVWPALAFRLMKSS